MSGFKYTAFEDELAQLQKRAYRQFKVVRLAVDGTLNNGSNQGTQGTTQFDVPFPGFFPCNALLLLNRGLMVDGRAVVASDTAARLFLEFNDSGQKLPFSLNANSGDLTSVSGTFRSCKVSVTTVGANGGAIFVALFLGISFGSSATVGGSSGGGGGYGPPPGGNQGP